MKNLFTLLFCFWYLGYATAANCTWTGPVGGHWNNPFNWSCNAVPGPLDHAIIIDGDVVLDSTATVGSLAIGLTTTIGGPGMLHINGAFNLPTGGTYTFLAEINAYGTATFGDCTIHVNAQAFRVFGGGISNGGELWMEGNGVFTIPTGATFEVNGPLNVYGFAAFPTFVVNGNLLKSGTGNIGFEAIYRFDHASLNIQTGYVVNYLQQDVAVCAIHKSVINISAGAALRTERVIDIDSSTFNGSGNLHIVFGSTNLLSGNVMNGPVLLENGILFAPTPLNLSAVKQTGGKLSANNVTIFGTYEWSGGDFQGPGIIAGQTIITDATPEVASRLCVGLHVAGSGSCSCNDKFLGLFTIPEGATFNFYGSGLTDIYSLNLNGTLKKSAGNPLLVSSFLLPAGGSRIEGIGRLTPAYLFVGYGTLAPGLPIGKLEVGPTYFRQQSTGVLEIDLYHDQNLTANDTLSVLGKAQLDGLLKVTETGNLPNGTYPILIATDSVSGAFTALDLPAGYSVVYETYRVLLIKNLASDVGEPDGASTQMGISPNPGSANCRIDLKGASAPAVRLRVIRPNGQLMYQKVCDFKSGLLQENLPVGNWPAGPYWIQIAGPDWNICRRWVKC